MFIEFQSNNIFKDKYFELLKYRLAFASSDLESDDDVYSAINTIKIYNQLQAVNYIFNKDIKNMKHMEFTNLICEVASILTDGEINNFRKIDIQVGGSNVLRTKPNMIRNDLWYLFDDYKYRISLCKSEDEILEVEAWFHIRFLHIHPFEDCNGRTSRILLLYNMCKNNIAPFIITKDKKREYCTLIENGNYKELALMFKELSMEELPAMISLYKELDDQGLIESNKMTSDQEKEYNKLKHKTKIKSFS